MALSYHVHIYVPTRANYLRTKVRFSKLTHSLPNLTSILAVCYTCGSSESWRRPIQENTVSVFEAAKLLGVGRHTVYRLVKGERLSAHRKTHAPQSPFMIDRASLEAYDRARRALPFNCKTATLLR